MSANDELVKFYMSQVHKKEEQDETMYDVIIVHKETRRVESKTVWLGIKGRARAEKLRAREDMFYKNEGECEAILTLAGRASLWEIYKQE